MGTTEELAVFISAYDDIPAAARDAAQRAILDTLGVLLAGTQEDCARIASEVVRARDSRPVAAVIGQGYRTSPEAAAFANGVAAHALDYDDVNSPMTGHPSVPLVPAILAVAEATGAAGRAALDAFVIGFEVEVKLGRAIGPSHYLRGWHATGTLGVLGAAAAAARLYHLNPYQTRMALGIAASMASGLRQNFGTMTKPLHPGHAAQNGVLAAQLAAKGFTADEAILESPIGYFNLFSPQGDADGPAATAKLADPLELLSSGLSVKRYPCCYATHRAIEATLELVAGERLNEQDVERIEVRVPRGASEPLIHPRPVTGLEGKFSMEYCVAAAVLDGRVGLDSFEDAAVGRESAQQLLRRVEASATDDESRPAEGYADVHILFRDGRRLAHRVDEPLGTPSRPVTLEQLAAKYRDCAGRALGIDACERSLAMLLDFGRLDSLEPLTTLLLAPAVAPA